MIYEFPPLSPAGTLDEVWTVFNPDLSVDPNSEYYIPRTDPKLGKLSFGLKRSAGFFHAFLCGHGGSGKTTELKRLCLDPDILKKYHAIYMTTKNFTSEFVHLTHDAVMVEIGLKLIEEGKAFDMDPALEKELENWGKQIVNTFLHDENVKTEVGAKPGAWFAFFKAQLGTRREWKREEKQILEPRVQDLVDILNRIAQDLTNRTGKHLLVFVDDLEKGDSDAHRAMHMRLFQENYDTLVQPRFSIIYTIPVYFRALPGSRIPGGELYSFSAARLYQCEHKKDDNPLLSTQDQGYKLMRGFVEKRLSDPETIFAQDVLDELLRIGGGLFRETARAIRDAAYFALNNRRNRIEMEDAHKVYNEIKKEYQPLIRGDAVRILKEVLESSEGWVQDVEPFLQRRAVVEYENDHLWIDLRYVLKPYIRGLTIGD